MVSLLLVLSPAVSPLRPGSGHLAGPDTPAHTPTCFPAVKQGWSLQKLLSGRCVALRYLACGIEPNIPKALTVRGLGSVILLASCKHKCFWRSCNLRKEAVMTIILTRERLGDVKTHGLGSLVWCCCERSRGVRAPEPGPAEGERSAGHSTSCLPGTSSPALPEGELCAAPGTPSPARRGRPGAFSPGTPEPGSAEGERGCSPGTPEPGLPQKGRAWVLSQGPLSARPQGRRCFPSGTLAWPHRGESVSGGPLYRCLPGPLEPGPAEGERGAQPAGLSSVPRSSGARASPRPSVGKMWDAGLRLFLQAKPAFSLQRSRL